MKRKLLLIIFIGLIAFMSISVFATDNTTSVKPDIELGVNDVKNVRIGSSGTLTFKARVTNSYTPGDIVTWSSEIGAEHYTSTSTLNNEGIAELSLTYADLSALVFAGSEYVMQASYNTSEGVITDEVKYGVVGENPAVVFTEYASDIEASLNDPIHLKAQTYRGSDSTSLSVNWTCEEATKLSAGYSCPGIDTEDANIAYKSVGTYTITTTVRDNDDKVGTASIRIKVVNDPPKISLSTNKNSDLYEVSETATVSFTASDKYGTIHKIMWGCSNDGNIDYDNEKNFDPAKKKETTSVTIDLPDFETDSYKCSFKAVDDDAEEGVASVVFKTHIPSQEPTPTEPTKAENPKTGDFVHIYVMLFIVSSIGIATLRKRYN
jgi:hypothetical protein